MFWLILGIIIALFIAFALGAANGVTAMLVFTDLQIDDKEILDTLNKIRKSSLYQEYVKRCICKPWKN